MQTAKYMLDTDTLSFVMKGRDEKLRKKFSQRLPRIAISAVTLAEIRYGLLRRHSDKLNAVFTLIREMIPTVPWSDAAAERYAEIRNDLESAGTPIGALDMMIAAAAVSSGSILVTNNVKHFRHVKGLKIENWITE